MSSAQRRQRLALPPHTGWGPGLLQDDHKGLSQWFASRPDARRIAREVCRQIEEHQDMFYVISVHHTLREDLYITIWRPNDRGYCWALSRAGCYSRENVKAHQGYYNTGGDGNVAVPCLVLDRIAIPPRPGHHDNDTGPVVPNNRESWRVIAKHLIAKPAHPLEPQYPGARRPKKVQYA